MSEKFVHVVTLNGAQFIGKLVGQREVGQYVWVELSPVYGYKSGVDERNNIQQNSFPAWFMEGSESMKTIATTITELRAGSHAELEREAVGMAHALRAAAANIALAERIPNRRPDA